MSKIKRRNKRKWQRNIIIVSVICLTFTLITAYSAFSTKLNITAKGNVVDKSRTIQSWAEVNNVDFHTDFYRENIITATFLDTAKVPENAIESWDVSASKDGGVMAYVTESQIETGKYDLFIGAKDGIIANEDSRHMFHKFTNLISIDFKNNFDTSNVTNMAWMFDLCTNLKSLDLSNFNTTKVTTMEGIFCGTHSITTLDLSSFDTRNVTNMHAMFHSYAGDTPMSLETIIFGDKFVTNNVTNMRTMFYGCTKLKQIDLSNFDTSNVTDMSTMFELCKSLTELNLCSFNTKKVTDMTRMFRETTNLTKIKVGPNWTTTNADTTNMFLNSKISQVTTGEC